jgi:protein-disulfide isomerase
VRAATIPFLLALTVPACSVFFPPDPVPAPAASVALPGPPDAQPLHAAASEPRLLPGLGAVDLDARENRVFWNMISQLYAPCPSEAVSIVQCIDEKRACAACMPAARLIAEKIKAGATPDQAREIYGMRFGPNVKQVDAADSPARGPADAPVTIMVWSDFECPHCRHALPVIESLVEKNAPRVRLVHKFYPLRQHTHAEQAARAAIAAQNQGRYWEMERTLFEHQSEQEGSDLDRYAEGLKLDMNRFHADEASERTTKILERDHADAERAGLSGTPFILVNGREFDGTYFHVESDLDPWIKLELELIGKR